MAANLNEALEAYKPEIAARFETFIRNTFAAMVEDHGLSLKGAANSPRWARTLTNTVRPFLRKVLPEGQAYGFGGEPYEIHEERIKVGAAKYADEVVESLAVKIKGKMGELDNAEVQEMGNCTFSIFGTKFGKKVFIKQTMILNVSSKGMLFNQWPARIIVDGKSVSEAKFKKLQAPVSVDEELDLGEWVPDAEDPDASKADAAIIARRNRR